MARRGWSHWCIELVSQAVARVGWDEQRAVHLGGTGEPTQEQIARQFRAQQLQDMAHPGLPANRQSPQDGAAEQHRPCPQC